MIIHKICLISPKWPLLFRQVRALAGMARAKPPMVLVVEGEPPAGLLGEVARLVARDRVLVYPLARAALTSQPWQREAEVVVVERVLGEGEVQVVARWMEGGGKVWDFGANTALRGVEEEGYTVGERGETLASQLEQVLGEEVVEEQVAELTPGYLVTSNPATLAFLATLPSPAATRARLAMHFEPSEELQPSEAAIPVVRAACPGFDAELYTSSLATRALGQVVVVVPTITSTQEALTCRLAHGLVVVAGRQVAGVGRGGNRWLSPPGAAMFSLQLHLPSSSLLPPSLLQHLAALAVVQAALATTGVTLAIKWPNDLYLGREVKVGGVVVAASSGVEGLSATLGIGLNLDNPHPTTSLNSAAVEGGGEVVAREVLVAKVLGRLEVLVARVEEGRWGEVEQEYYSAWLHGGQEVVVEEAGGWRRQATVTGIDKFGFLRVAGEVGEFTVHDDGNSFDMMAGLVRPKARV